MPLQAFTYKLIEDMALHKRKKTLTAVRSIAQRLPWLLPWIQVEWLNYIHRSILSEEPEEGQEDQGEVKELGGTLLAV